jgi:glycosyltransferase involved in cell wall biosynthesis
VADRRPRALQLIAVSLAVPEQVLPVAASLVRAGWEVDVACAPGPETAVLAEHGVGYVPVPFHRRLATPYHLRTLAALVGVLRRGRYDVIHTHGPIPAVLARLAARVAGGRVVVHVRGTFFSEGPDAWYGGAVKAAYPLTERALAPLTAWTLALTPQDKQDLVERGGHDPGRVTVLGVGGCGLDLEVWNPDRHPPEARARTRRELGIPEGRTVIGFVGRIVREKGVLDLLEAFHLLRQGGREDLHLLMVGGVHPSERDQETGRELRARIERLGLEAHVSLPGHIRPVAPAVAVMDVMALPSYREGIANALLEAGALGKPVVGAACRGVVAAIREGETGLLCPVGDVPALAEVLGRVISDPGLAGRLGEAGRLQGLRMGRDEWMRTVHGVYQRVLDP